jgi:hypothetical protein
MASKQPTEEFVADLTDMAEIFGKRLTDSMTDRYWEALQEYPQERLSKASAWLLNNSKRWPTIAEWIECLRTTAPTSQAPALPDKTVGHGPPPGLSRYVAMAVGNSKSPMISAFGSRDVGRLPRLTGKTYQDRLRQALEIAKQEKASLRTLRILEGACRD